ncbi:MAG: hypothetical protein AAF597_16515, partial [Bacteroidota bacterium]
KQKLEKLVLSLCSYSEIKSEVLANVDYFTSDLEFDGGFKLNSLLSSKEHASNPPKDIMKTIVDRVDKTRNVLVHIRESRENKVIFPTKRNNRILTPYIQLIRRLAEIVAIKNN